MKHTIVAAAAIVLAVAGCASKPATPANAAPASTPPVTIRSTLSTAPPTTSDRDKLRAWYENGGGTIIDKLTTDFNKASTAANAKDLTATGKACRTMRTDVEAAQQYDPLPVKSVQTPWAKALAEFARGASDCIAGLRTGDGALISQAGDELVKGTDYLTDADTAIHAIAG